MSSRDPVLPSQRRKIARLRSDLKHWYKEHGRSFPWRRDDATEFERICVEVLLQRTRAETIERFYVPFFSRYKGWEEIANAPLDDLEEALKPVGLWRRRARALQGLASYAVGTGGRFPDSHEGLAEVPAVGQYVANAILMFQHRLAAPLLDVNMARLLERVVRPRSLADIRYDPWLQEAAHLLVRDTEVTIINWAALDFAAKVCTARSPRCAECRFKRRCTYFRRGTT